MMMGIGTPISHSKHERMGYPLIGAFSN